LLPVQNPQTTYHTLEEIRQRKDELLAQMQADNKQFSAVWNEIFIKREDSTRHDFIAGIVNNTVTVIDLFLLYRKVKKNYGGIVNLFSKKKR